MGLDARQEGIIPPPHEPDQDGAREKSAEMREPPDVVVAGKQGRRDLQNDPETDGPIRRNPSEFRAGRAPTSGPADRGSDRPPRRPTPRRTPRSRVASTPDRRTRGSRSRGSAQQHEDEEAQVAHGVLDVVPEDPKEKHVAEEVEPGPVQEHRCREGRPHRHEGEALRQSWVLKNTAGINPKPATTSRRRSGRRR